MAGPEYKPDEWNKPDTKLVNDCYNYATNNKFVPKSGQPAPLPAQPGKTKGIMPYFYKGYVNIGPGGPTFVAVLDCICEGVATAAKLDGLKDPTLDPNKKPTCASDCWLVAYYVRAATSTLPGDFHFVRQDSDGGWSHLPSWGGTVTRNKYDPDKQNYDKNDPIKDPEKDNVGRDYKFCGYLCCCPDTKVASLLPGEGGMKSDVLVSLCTTSMGRAMPLSVPYSAAEIQGIITSFMAQTGTTWSEGFGDGRLLYRVDMPTVGEVQQTSAFVTDSSVTVWDGAARHVDDLAGEVAAQLGALLGQTPSVTAGPTRRHPQVFRQTFMTRRDVHRGFVLDGPHTVEHSKHCCTKIMHSQSHGISRTRITILHAAPLGDQPYDLPWGSEVILYPEGDLVVQIV